MTETPSRPRLLLLDRDGVLNYEAPSGFVLEAEQWRWQSGLPAVLVPLSTLGIAVCVVTNQSCVGRGLMTWEALDRVHARMRDEAAAVGVTFAAVYACPHAPDEGCACRKPRPGLLLTALAEQGVAPGETVMVGDATTDLEAARAAGLRCWLVRTGKGRRTEEELQARGDHSVPIFDTLHEVLAELARLPAPNEL